MNLLDPRVISDAVNVEAVASAPPEPTLNDAHVYGDISPDILGRTIKVAMGSGRKDTAWVTKTVTFEQLRDFLTKFERGPKEGRSITSGGLATSPCAREDVCVTENFLLMVDFDSGEAFDKIADKIKRAGLLCILYSTHSSGKAESRLKNTIVLKHYNYPREPITNRQLAEFLRQTKNVNPAVLADIADPDAAAEQKYIAPAMNYILRHAPMPRLRAVFLLEAPFDFNASSERTNKQALDEWKELYAGFCAQLGVVFDSACAHAANLMYTPRIPEGSEIGKGKHEILVLAGATLDLEKVERVSTKTASGKQVAPRDAGGATRGAQQFKTKNIPKFLAVGAYSFRAGDCAAAIAPDDVRHAYEDGCDFKCPNEDGHTNPEPMDRAFRIWNASGIWGFNMSCRHDGCKALADNGKGGQDRGVWLDLFCQAYDVTDAADLMKWCSPEAQAAWNESERAKEARGRANAGQDAKGPPKTYRTLSTRADQIEERAVEWLWQDHIPFRALTEGMGPTKVGKSTFAAHIIACATNGLPFDTGSKGRAGRTPIRPPMSCLLISGEDAPNEVLVPRLKVAGADLSLVTLVKGYEEISADGTTIRKPFTLKQAYVALRSELVANPAIRLIVVDPVNAFLGGDVDAHRNNEVRSVLNPLKELAEEFDVAILIMHHMKKGQKNGSVTDMSGGSNAFVEAVRAVFALVPEDQNDPEKGRFILQLVASNYGRSGQGYVYVIEEATTDLGNRTSRFVIQEGEKPAMSAAQAISGAGGTEGDGDKRQDAREFLLGMLAGGGEVDYKEIAKAAKADSQNLVTVRRAFRAMKGVSTRAGFGADAETWWRLPLEQYESEKLSLAVDRVGVVMRGGDLE
jgi:RecA-family ATPase